MAQTIREIMTKDPVCVSASAPVTEAASEMKSENIGDVIVLDDDRQICGIVTDRDITIRVVAEGRDVSSVKVGDICSRDIQTLAPDDDVSKAVEIMRDRAVRRLPIVENGQPVGIVSIGDLAVERDQQSALADISASKPNS